LTKKYREKNQEKQKIKNKYEELPHLNDIKEEYKKVRYQKQRIKY